MGCCVATLGVPGSGCVLLSVPLDPGGDGKKGLGRGPPEGVPGVPPPSPDD